jgi:hypothetical protein
MTMLQRQQYLHEIIPDGVFWDGSVVFLCLFDYGREVPATAVFHEDVEDTCLSVDISVMISYNVFVVKVFQNISVYQIRG